MKKLSLTGKLREETKKQIKKLRRDGLVPAVIYGPNRKSTNVLINRKEFVDIYKIAEETRMIDFNIEGEKESSKVIIREVQLPPLGGEPLHVSLFEIDMKKKIVVSVMLEFIGESKAVKDNIGILITPVSELPIRSLPGNIPEKLTVDISNLNEIGDSIKISDINLPEDVEWDSGLVTSNNVADIVPPQKEIVEEVKPVEEAEGAVEGEKKEGEEGAAVEEGEKAEEKK